MATMHPVDWAVVLGYVLLALTAGFWLRRRASADLASYFVAGRKLSGWLIGTSMVATTFAADTPLAVTGLVAEHGIAGNWFWWSFAFSHIAAAFVFSRLWRRAELITDVELIELRYGGRPAAWLRFIRAFYFAVPINCITMAWVIRAMGKIVKLLFPWEKWLPAHAYGFLQAHWPQGLAIQSPSEGLSILVGVTIAFTYALLGGLPSVILTDVVQFVLAMIGSVALAVAAVSAVGGLAGLRGRLESVYSGEAENILSLWPAADAAWLPLEAFLVFLCVQWWAWKYSDGGGILVQRMSAAKDEGHALRGTSFFVLAHYVLRPWPWILVGLAALVIYPLGDPAASGRAALVANDREMAYPVLMVELLPAGLLGVMITGMAAAFMSTIDTHINWGASYLIRDVYQRFLRPEASQKQLVRAGRVAMGIILLVALAITTQIGSIAGAWKFLTAMSAGLGLVSILRWLWWRINAYSEMAGLVSAALTALVIYGIYGSDPFAADIIPYHQVLVTVVSTSSAAVLLTTVLTAPVGAETLRQFYARVQPVGFWGPVADSASAPMRLGTAVLAWLAASGGVFAMLFGLGEWLLGSAMLGGFAVGGGALAFAGALKLTKAFGAPEAATAAAEPSTAQH